MRKTSKWAAPVQTEAASKINRLKYITTPANCSSKDSEYAPDQRSPHARPIDSALEDVHRQGDPRLRAEQLFIFALDGALSEPFMPARRRRKSTTYAAAGEGVRHD